MRFYLLLCLGILFICNVLKPTVGKPRSLSNTTGSIKTQKSTKPKFRESDTFYKSKSYQSMVVMNGSGTPVSEKKMSSFSVEDHNGNNG